MNGKLMILLQIILETHKKELQMKHTMGECDFNRMCENVSSFANEHRITESRGRKDMERDAMDEDRGQRAYTDAEWQDYVDENLVEAEDLRKMEQRAAESAKAKRQGKEQGPWGLTQQRGTCGASGQAASAPAELRSGGARRGWKGPRWPSRSRCRGRFP